MPIYLRDRCEVCGETDLSFVDKRFGHCTRKARRSLVKVRTYSDYEAGLARFPGDPEARTGGSERKRAQLIEKRKRQGWEQVNPADALQSKAKLDKEAIKREIHERLK